MQRYYTSRDWGVAAGVAAIVLVVYGLTLAPTITMEYSGQFVVAADHLGVARPPGYPIWHLLAKAFTILFSWVSYRGHPNPAWAVNFLSAVFGAFSCGTLALIVSRQTKRLFSGSSRMSDRYVSLLSGTAAVSSALLFGFTQALWSQAVISETHTLTCFYLLVLLAVLLRWTSTGVVRAERVVAFLVGLALPISYMALLVVPAVLVAAACVSARAFARTVGVTAVFAGFLFAEWMVGWRSPTLAAAILAAPWLLGLLLLLPRATRSVGGLLLLVLIGTLFYAYLPLAASHNPPMSMGHACSWEGFWHVLHRGQYERLRPVNPFLHFGYFVEQLHWYLHLAALQYTRPLLSMMAIPLLLWPWLPRPARRDLAVVGVALFMFSVVTLVGASASMDLQTTLIALHYFIPSFAFLAILMGYAQVILLDGLGERRLWARDSRTARERCAGAGKKVDSPRKRDLTNGVVSR